MTQQQELEIKAVVFSPFGFLKVKTMLSSQARQNGSSYQNKKGRLLVPENRELLNEYERHIKMTQRHLE